ncbi:MAG: PhzF family phenazine biosynthesis protein [Candidatus Aminicenantes bacterium]|nr:PhzF family phenazine biosynthesis protein [Candidatus Aminicenantes bacterium]
MSLPLFQVDAFTSKPYRGNPAAVCLLDRPASSSWMQMVAAEMNLSETAFLLPERGGFRLRWFTPRVEVKLCGHATLASAHVLWEEGILPPAAEARFRTRSGLLTAARRGRWIELDFPSRPAGPAPAAWAAGLSEALKVKPVFIGRSVEDALLEIAGEDRVRELWPDLVRIERLPVRGVIVTSRAAASSRGYDFVSRFFAPAVGVDEDPVTGSAHCVLGPYWAAKLGKKAMTACQVSPRGGILKVKPAGDRVKIAGRAVTVFRAALRPPGQ